MLDEALGLGAEITYTVDEDFASQWAAQLVEVLQPASQMGTIVAQPNEEP